jgi:hypothetical protein
LIMNFASQKMRTIILNKIFEYFIFNAITYYIIT